MFIFKTIKPAGPYRSDYNPVHIIKIKEACVGTIENEYPHKVHVKIIKKDIRKIRNPFCCWEWIMLKERFPSVKEAKKFLKSNFDIIISKYNIYIDNGF